jgi:hypothetical protein
MITQDNIEHLTVFAEQYYCKDCKTNSCEIFTNGSYEKCAPLLLAFEKQESDYHAFLTSVQRPYIPGKCVLCRNDEINDKDTNYTLITLRNNDGTIRMRGYLCSHHYNKEMIKNE